MAGVAHAAPTGTPSQSAYDLYKDARYREAASKLQSKKRQRATGRRTSRLVLDHHNNPAHLQGLAYETDALLCEARSIPTNGHGYIDACQAALGANTRYRDGLFELLNMLSRQEQSPASERRRGNVLEGLLLALLSASWLNLQMKQPDLARDILVEDLRRLSPILSRLGSATTMLLSLPEVLQHLEIILPSDSLTWRQFHHTLRVLDFVPGTKSQSSYFQSACESVCVGAGAYSTQESPSEVQLRVRQLLLKSLELDRQLRESSEVAYVHKRGSRDQLLDEAVSIETAKAKPTSTGNLAVRVKTLVDAVEAMRVGDTGGDYPHPKKELISTLESQLGYWRSDAVGWNLLGCLKAGGDVDGALECFLRAQELDPTQQESGFNVAKCFLSIGESSHGRDILASLSQSTQVDLDHSNKPATPYIISNDSETRRGEQAVRSWALYLASTLDEDVSSQLEAIDGLSNKIVRDSWAFLARVFSYLQSGSFLRAYRLMQASENLRLCPLERLTMDLYRAEAVVRGSLDTSLLPPLTPLHDSSCELVLTDSTLESSGPYNAEILTVLDNNRGMLHLVHGRKQDAVECFRRACKVTNRFLATNLCSQQVFLPLLFNQSLLLWTDKKVTEACAAWFPIRNNGPLNPLQAQAHGIPLMIQKCLDEYETRHGSFQQSRDAQHQSWLLLDFILLMSAEGVRERDTLASLLQNPNR